MDILTGLKSSVPAVEERLPSIFNSYNYNTQIEEAISLLKSLGRAPTDLWVSKVI